MTVSFQMEMEEVAVEVVAGLHPSSTYQQSSSTQPLRLIQAALRTVLAQETEGPPGWLPQPPGPPSAHPEQTTDPWACRYYGQMNGFVCLDGWMANKDLTSVPVQHVRDMTEQCK